MTDGLLYQPNYLLREELSVKPNQRLILVHPTLGYLPLIVRFREPFYFIFDRILTDAGLSSLGPLNSVTQNIVSEQFLDSINRDVLQVNSTMRVYHLFIGLSPPSLKVYLEFPKGNSQRIPDNQTFSPTSTFGYIDGWNSPFEDPGPIGETVLPWGRNITGFTFHNPTTVAMPLPLMKLVGYTYLVEVIRDAQLVYNLLTQRTGFGARYLSMGGTTSYPYDSRQAYDADWIPFTWGSTPSPLAEIQKDLAPSTKVAGIVGGVAGGT